MKTTYLPGKKLEQSIYVDAHEDFITLGKAVMLYASRAPFNRSDFSDDEVVAMQQIGNHQEALRITCDEIVNDLGSGSSRLARGYGGLRFNTGDSHIIDRSVERLADLTPETIRPGEEAFLTYVPSARYMIEHMETDFADMGDLDAGLRAVVEAEAVRSGSAN